MNLAPGPRDQAGFTLAELLVVVVILGIVMVPLTMAMVVGVRTTDRTASVLVTSADRQRVSTYLPSDVAASSTVDLLAGTATGCSGPSPGGTNVLLLTSKEFVSGTTTTYRVAYRVVPHAVPSGTEYHLVRFACTNGGATTQLVLARHLESGSAVTVPVPVNGTISMTLTDTLHQQYTVSGARRLA